MGSREIEGEPETEGVTVCELVTDKLLVTEAVTLRVDRKEDVGAFVVDAENVLAVEPDAVAEVDLVCTGGLVNVGGNVATAVVLALTDCEGKFVTVAVLLTEATGDADGEGLSDGEGVSLVDEDPEEEVVAKADAVPLTVPVVSAVSDRD